MAHLLGIDPQQIDRPPQLAQLRDSQTGECVFEGTPLECVYAAEDLGDDVMFDNVGEGFDPEVVKKSREDELAGLKRAAKDISDDGMEAMKLTIKDREDRMATGKKAVPQIRKKIAAARKLGDLASG